VDSSLDHVARLIELKKEFLFIYLFFPRLHMSLRDHKNQIDQKTLQNSTLFYLFIYYMDIQNV